MVVKPENRVAKLETEIAQTLFESCDTAISLSCSILLRNGEYDQLVSKRINPADYINQRTFALDWQAVHALSKTKVQQTTFDRDRLAYEKYLESEASCGEFNNSFHERLASDLEFFQLLERMKYWIERILGPLTRRDLSFAENKMRFGPGATTSVSGSALYAEKYRGRQLDVSPRLLPFAVFCIPELWRQEKPSFRVRRSARGCIVPKNAKISRCIEIQPDLNVYVQLGVGSLLRQKLKHFGVDLNSQELNREMARQGSIDDSLATIDLSSASDLISLALVRHVLPARWLELLELSRTDLVEWPDRTVLLEKWSAMGNGYTFELETLIFYSMLLAVCDRHGYGYDQVMAYGDDLVVPSEFLAETTRAVTQLGFSVNRNKTFGEGLFRESCGHDYWNGVNIRPFFLKGEEDETTTFPEVCHQYGNSIRLWSRRLGGDSYCDSVAVRAWVRCYAACPSRYRYRIPDGWSGGFISNFDEARPTYVREDGWGGFRFKKLERESRRSRVIPQSYIAALAGQSNKLEFTDWEVRPRKLDRISSSVGYVLTWPNLGPWM